MARRKNTATEATPEATTPPASKRNSKKDTEPTIQIPDELTAAYQSAGLEIKSIGRENGGGFGVIRSNGKTGRSKRYETLDICADVPTLETWINDFMVEQENSAAQEAATSESQEVIDPETAQDTQETIEAATEAEAPLEVAELSEVVAPAEPAPVDDRSLEGWTDVIMGSDTPAPAVAQADPEWQHGIGICPFAPQLPGAWTTYRGSEIFMVDQSGDSNGSQWAVFVRFNEQGGWANVNWENVPLIDTPQSFGEGQEKAIATVDQWLTDIEGATADTGGAEAIETEEDLRPVQDIFTTAPDTFDIQADLVSSEVLPFVNAEGRRWRLVKTRNYDKQRDVYSDADGGLFYAAIGRLFWDGGTDDKGKPVIGMAQFQIASPLDASGEETPAEPTTTRRGRRRRSEATSNNGSTPAPVVTPSEDEDDLTPVAVPESIKVIIATPAMNYYKPVGITQTMPPEWQQAIALLEEGATIDQLNELLGVNQKPFYYSQNLGRYGKGMKKDGDRYVLV